MKSLWPYLLLALMVILGYGVAHWIQDDFNGEGSIDGPVFMVEDCDLAIQSCSWQAYRLDMDRPVRPLTPLKARLASELPLGSAVLYLEMRDMDMGVNRFVFSLREEGRWVADIMIPICVTGRRDWEATLVLTYDGRKEKLIFPLTVEGL